VSKRYGKARVQGCYCDSDHTCGACMRAAPPWHNTPSTIAEQASREAHERWLAEPEGMGGDAVLDRNAP
jgi:hypothetical protein